MDTNLKIMIGSIAATVIIIIGAAIFLTQSSTPEAQGIIADPAVLIRDDGYNSKGPADAPVTIVEFSDFECPSCRGADPIIKAMMDKYPDQIHFIYRHFPLPQHPFARDALFAAEAAGKQGKFWEMHDLLFKNQSDFKPEIFEQLAQELELDMDQFRQDLQSEEAKQHLQSDMAAASKLKVNSTPTVYVNNIKLNQGVSLEDLENAIVRELAKLPTPTESPDATPSANQEATPSAE